MNRKLNRFAPGARAVPARSSSAATNELGHSEPLLDNARAATGDRSRSGSSGFPNGDAEATGP